MIAELFESSVLFGVFITCAVYLVGLRLRAKTGLPFMHPLLIGVVLMMLFLSAFDVEYAVYSESVKMLSGLLTPATICLAVPLYRNVSLLRRYPLAIVLGIASGVATSLACILGLSLLFGLDHAAYVTLLPKSITTAIGMSISAQLGGYVPITIAVIIITGIFGNMIAVSVCRILRITEPAARGVAIGTASHAIGTSKAMEMGEVEGAMSSLSIVIAGILTVFGANLFAGLI